MDPEGLDGVGGREHALDLGLGRVCKGWRIGVVRPMWAR